MSWIEKNKTPLLILLVGFALNFTSNFSLVIGASIFLKNQGASQVPYFYILLNTLSIVLGMACYRFNFQGKKWLVMIVSIMTVLLLLFGLSEVAFERRVVYGVYVSAGLFHIYAFIFFWNFVNDSLTIRELKSWVGIMSGVFSCGAILSGFLMKPVLNKLPIHQCFVLAGGVYALLVILLIVAMKSPKRTETELEKKGEDPPTISNPLVMMCAAFVFSYAFIRYFLDYRYSIAITQLFTSETDLAVFMGTFNSVLRTLTIAYHVSLSAKVLRSISISQAMGVVPALVPFLCFLNLFWDNPWAVIAFQFLLIFFLNGFTQPTINVLFSALDSRIKGKARFLNEGIFFCFAVLLAGGLALVYERIGFESNAFFYTLLAVAILWFLLSSKLTKVYLAALQSNLSGEAMVAGRDFVFSQGLVNQVDFSTQLGETIRNKSRGRRQWIRRLVLNSHNSDARSLLRDILLDSKNPELQLEVSRAICRAKLDYYFEGVLADMLEQGTHFTEEQIIYVLDSYAISGRASFLSQVRPFLKSENPRLKARCILHIIKLSSWKAEIQESMQELIAMLESEDSSKISAIAVLGELGLECFLPALESLGSQSSGEVLEAVALSLGKIQSVQSVQILNRLLENPKVESEELVIREQIQKLESHKYFNLEVQLASRGHDQKQRLVSCLNLLPAKYHSSALKAIRRQPVRGLLLLEALSYQAYTKDLKERLISMLDMEPFAWTGLLNDYLNKEQECQQFYEILQKASLEDSALFEQNLAMCLSKMAESGIPKSFHSMKMKEVLHLSQPWLESSPALEQTIEKLMKKERVALDVALELIENSCSSESLTHGFQNLFTHLQNRVS